METIETGPVLHCGEFDVVPVERRFRAEYRLGGMTLWQWTREPIGIQVRGRGERYALDLEGNRADELLRY